MTTSNDTDTVIDATIAKEAARRVVEDQYGEVWDTTQLQQFYDVEGFCCGICSVRRKSDGGVGMLEFTHSPRFYHSFAKL